MTLTRWKLMAGLLGLSMGGVAATADPPCRVKAAGPPCPAPCPVVVTIPVVSAPTPPEVVLVGLPPTAPPPAVEPAPSPKPIVENVLDLQLPPPAIVPAAAPPPPPPAAVLELPALTPSEPRPAVGLPPTTPVAAPAKPELPAPKRLDPPAVPTEPARPTPDGAVRVVLRLGVGQPRCEVLTGDDVLLKVVSDKVDVKSPSEKGETMSALKAVGGVRFSAPGCEGTCHELTVLPGPGDVELSGDVRVKCKQGKGETEIVASKLTFKLGSAPAYAVPEPTTTVNTSHTTPTRR